MVNELGPWSLRGILKESLRIYRRNFPTLFLLSPFLSRHLGGLLLSRRLPGFGAPLDVLLSEWPLSPHLYFVVGMQLIAMPILVGTMMLSVGHYCVSRRLAVRRSFQRCYRQYPALLGLDVAMPIVIVIVLGLSFLAGKVIWPGHGAGMPRFLIAASAVIIGIILTLKLATVWGLIYQPVLFEGLGPIAALKASENLTCGRRWPVFFVAVVLDTCLVSIPSLNNMPPVWVQMLVSSVFYPIAVIASTLLYFSLHVEKNGLTLGHLARALDTPVAARLRT